MGVGVGGWVWGVGVGLGGVGGGSEEGRELQTSALPLWRRRSGGRRQGSPAGTWSDARLPSP